MTDISNMRKSFERNQTLDIDSVPDDPFQFFDRWFNQARKTPEIAEPNGFVLSTANRHGRIRSRTVLLKFFDTSGFVFYTNYGSQKAKDIEENQQVSVCFPWYHLERQVLIEGRVEKVSHAESLKYFASRPRSSQIGAWVSEQSQVIASRALLMDKVKQLTRHFVDKDVPLPKFWGGYRIRPQRFEFWQGQPSRLHDRIQYTPCTDNNGDDNNPRWFRQRLAP
ncbi:MAG: pyridoxamine 5'-phosphate oxidase [Gammaproteobacteria bacterium]|nr:MAG: pyridoxamine 5'-phosphate oxidase [Gammaproteobacteria bacterium]